MPQSQDLLTPTEFAQRIKAKYPDYKDVPDDVLAAKMLEKYPEYRDRVVTPDFRIQNLPVDIQEEFTRTMADGPNSVSPFIENLKALGKMLPSILGGIGGMAGGVPGAAAGGAAGAGYQDLVARGKQIPGAVADIIGNPLDPIPHPLEALKGFTKGAGEGFVNAGKHGAVQGASELAGQKLVGGGKVASTWLMSRAVNASQRLQREFPNLPQIMIDNALTVSRGGLEKARKILLAGKAQANTALGRTTEAGVVIPIEAATKGLDKTMDTVANSADVDGGLQALIALERKIKAGRPETLTLEQADKLKRSLQLEAKALYIAAKSPNGRPAMAVAAQGKADMAEALNAAIELATQNAGAPGYKAGNAIARDMIGARRGIEQGTRHGTNLYQAMVRPGMGALMGGAAGATGGHPWAGAAAGAFLTSPTGMSHGALLLANPVFQRLLQQLPRASAQAVISALDTSRAGQTPD